MIETFVYGILDEFYSFFRGSLGYVDSHISERILEEHTLSNSSRFFCDFQDPSCFLCTFVFFSQLNYTVSNIRIEKRVIIISIFEMKSVGLLCIGYHFDIVMLSLSPVTEH